MKRIYYIMAALLFCAASVNAQVRIGSNDDPHQGAILDLQSDETENKGILFPRVSLTALDDFSPVTGEATDGMVVYNINGELGKGLYIWDSEKWAKVSDGSGDDGKEPEEPATELPAVTIASDVNVATITDNTPVVLTANVTTAGTNNYQWYKNGVAVSDETSATFSISSIAIGDQYSCAVTNSVGSTTAYWSTCGAYITYTEWLSFMCHNLGADESKDPFTYSTVITGDLYQWGRIADGHEKRSSPSASGPVAADTYCDDNGQVVTTATNYYGKFITGVSGSNYNWHRPKKDDLWNDDTKTASDPCPKGWRVPTKTQWNAVLNYNEVAHTPGEGLAIGNSLFLPSAGCRGNGATVEFVGSSGFYWSSTVDGTGSDFLRFSSITGIRVDNFSRVYGMSVRCVAEN